VLWDAILHWFDSKIANGPLEGISSPFQAAKGKARGYKVTCNLKAIIYLVAAKLELSLTALNQRRTVYNINEL
jgi:hypothetical protein